eukprot:3784172-Pyramimonas_sp.AAC.1
MRRLRVECQMNRGGPKKSYAFSARTWWITEEWPTELGKRPREGGPAAEPVDLEEHEKVRDERIADNLPPPMGMYRRTQVERDNRDML